MGQIFQDLTYNPYVSQYVPLPTQELMQAGTALQDRADKTYDAMEAGKAFIGNIPVWELDEADKNAYMAELDKSINGTLDKYDGRYHDRGFAREVGAMINRYSRDPKISRWQNNLKEIESVKEMKKKLGAQALNFNPYDNFRTVGENGELNTYRADIEQKLDWDARMESLVNDLKADSSTIGLSQADFDMLKYGKLTELGDKKINAYLGHAMDRYKQTAEYSQQKRALMELQGITDPHQADAMIQQALLGAARERKVRDIDYNYAGDPTKSHGSGSGENHYDGDDEELDMPFDVNYKSNNDILDKITWNEDRGAEFIIDEDITNSMTPKQIEEQKKMQETREKGGGWSAWGLGTGNINNMFKRGKDSEVRYQNGRIYKGHYVQKKGYGDLNPEEQESYNYLAGMMPGKDEEETRRNVRNYMNNIKDKKVATRIRAWRNTEKLETEKKNFKAHYLNRFFLDPSTGELMTGHQFGNYIKENMGGGDKWFDDVMVEGEYNYNNPFPDIVSSQPYEGTSKQIVRQSFAQPQALVFNNRRFVMGMSEGEIKATGALKLAANQIALSQRQKAPATVTLPNGRKIMSTYNEDEQKYLIYENGNLIAKSTKPDRIVKHLMNN